MINNVNQKSSTKKVYRYEIPTYFLCIAYSLTNISNCFTLRALKHNYLQNTCLVFINRLSTTDVNQ